MGGGSLFQVGNAVEFWRVLVHLSILALCLVLFEAALHHVEHKLSRYDKYQQMLRKGYRELMILGLLSLGLKVLKEFPGIQADSQTMLAFQVADLAIFILALALILQAITIFSQLRKHNNLGDRTELITAQDLVDSMSPPPAASSTTERTTTNSFSWFRWSRDTTHDSFDKEIVQQRLLRNLFLRRFGLPQLFPFSKYLRRAQANQISHMIEVEPSMWVLLLAVAWAICAFVGVLKNLNVDMPESRDLVEVFVAFAWTLVGVHVAVLLYFRTYMRRILNAAGYSDNSDRLLENLQAIAEEEAVAWRNEAADSALDTMHRVQEELEELEDHRDPHQHALLRHDTGLHLLVASFHNIKRWGMVKKRKATGVQPESPEINTRNFSRQGWHMLVMFLLMLNGFFIALLVQCAVYDLDGVYGDFGLIPAIMVPLPLFLNTFVFQQRMFRYFVTVCSVIHADASTLGEVVNQFSEIVELRSQFAATLLERLRDGDYSVLDLRAELDAYDVHKTGIIDVDQLRNILAAFGYRLTRFRFNSVAMLLFELRGTKVEYGQLLRLLMVSQAESPRESVQSVQGNQQRQHPLLRQSVMSFDDNARSFRSDRMTALSARRPLLARTSMGSDRSDSRASDFAMLSTPTLPPITRVSITATSDSQANMKNRNGRNPVLDRSHSHQFPGSTSRTLHDMFNVQRASESQAHAPPTDAYTAL
ncbi:hypothetical protein PF010_g9185 [Phytophthora fragariae]|uniref:EF-hand domain-containing protein n=1 Tax=Phytophthora fragariae TaxID=53985 RepID=A0A6G0LDK5_9STRA|nr:hypothetical protein PF010_g9185 [Phytophthora fragariae]KAE9236637.1 hypothetical protein PF004_g8797 [Phytophthora fragariae]